MFNKIEEEKTLLINENTELKFLENDAPFYSTLLLFHNGQEISDCSIKPGEKGIIKQNMDNYNSLMNALININHSAESKSLLAFIHLVENYKNNTIQQNFINRI